MTRNKSSKINHFMVAAPSGVVLTSAWLEEQGISSKLAWWYVHSGLLEKIGTNAFKKANDHITWVGALNALQIQLGVPIHVGGKTALHIFGLGHYVPMQGLQQIVLFASATTKLPKWFLTNAWDAEFEIYKSSLFSNDEGLVERTVNNLSLKIACPERAALELLYLYPQHQSLNEIHHLMENLRQLRPKLIQALLQDCRSIKVKRLFLHLNEPFNHPWFSRLDLTKIDLGKGKRVLAGGGKYFEKYELALPEVEEEYIERSREL